MNKPLYLFLTLTLFAFTAFTQTNPKAEKELLKIQDEWATARVKRDVPYLEKPLCKGVLDFEYEWFDNVKERRYRRVRFG